MDINVKYKINKELDRKMALVFSPPKAVDIERFYSKNMQLLETKVDEFDKRWRSIKDKFAGVIKKIFPDHSIKKMDCVGFVSIFNFNPRFLQNHTFQVYYNHKLGSVFVTMHELLHFIFYDYTISKHPALFKNLDTENGIYWDLAELFNSVILSGPLFNDLHCVKEPVFYPEHKKYLIEFRKIWENTRSVDKLIIDGLKIIEPRTKYIPDKSFGIIPIRKNNSDLLFLLVHHRGGHWAFPKGHQKQKESELDTAKRELFEETGITEVEILDVPFIEEKYTFDVGDNIYEKTNNYFVGIVSSEKTATPEDFKHEIEETRWLPFSEAMKLATFDTAKNVLKKACESALKHYYDKNRNSKTN